MSESLLNWDEYLQVASLSDVGMRRATNQDNLSVSIASSMEQWQRKGHVFIVADGMGAHAAGELASKLAIDHIPHLYAKYGDTSAPEAMKQAVQGANAEIHRRGQANEEFHNMGTTCSVLAILPQGAVCAHIGDSRVYRLTQNKIEQLTFDHSLVWEMRVAGQLTAEEERMGKVPKNVITRSLGPYAECKVDLEGPFPVQVGDTFLLCSDGLTGVISDTEIGSIIANMTPDEAANVLVDLANLRGGPDNITVVIVKVTHPKIATATNSEAGLLKAGARKSNYGYLPIFWAVAAGAVLLSLLFFFIGQNSVMAAVFGGLGIAITIYSAIRSILGGKNSQQVSENKRYGKGPYTRHNCASSAQFAKQLADMLKKLQQGALREKWQVDWTQLKAFTSHAESATKNQDHSTSIRSYGRAVSFLMDQLRNQGDSSGSSVDL
ncbi:MAG: protein phosphatase 2C domain-containing protein [Mariniblastus sp.]|nr:protein phosphatase 2C domain-containing protein [Mariniblastus sp.]